jgi:hypothetical protein
MHALTTIVLPSLSGDEAIVAEPFVFIAEQGSPSANNERAAQVARVAACSISDAAASVELLPVCHS